VKVKDLCSLETLLRELTGYRLTKSPLFPEFSLDRMFVDIIDCKVIKDNNRRQVLFFQTPDGGFYLKRSVLIREKDRLRHLLLPRRRWAEWRNLHRLQNAQIAAARPVMKGENKGVHPKIFFLLTEKVDGTPLKFDSLNDARKLGQYIAHLHSRGVYHADLHPGNIILKSNNQPCLIDVQEVFLLPWLPSWLRIYNLGKLFYHLSYHSDGGKWREELLSGYNLGRRELVTTSKLVKALDRHQQRYYRSRGKRCFKNSTGFVIVKSNELRGYKRRNFIWGVHELRQALEKGKVLKPARTITFNGVCIKIHNRKLFTPDRCLVSWKMSRALEVRNISTPRSLGYFKMDGKSFFLSKYLVDGTLLDDYLSSFTDEQQKRRALKELALWLKKVHDCNIWHKDFKSSSILYQNGHYYIVDLDGVRIRRLTEENKIVFFGQLNASLSDAITCKDRLRFYYYYSANKRPTRQQRRKIYREVWDLKSAKPIKSPYHK